MRPYYKPERHHPPPRQTVETMKSVLLLLLLGAMPSMPLRSDTCRIAQGGKASVHIVVGRDPCAASKHMAGVLEGMLKKITGASFVIESGGGIRFFRLTKESC